MRLGLRASQFKTFYFIFIFLNSGVLLRTREYWVLRGPRSSSFCSFWLPRNLSNHMDRQARTGDTVLVKSWEMTGRSHTLLWWLEGGGVKMPKKKHIGPVAPHCGCINVQRTFPLSSSLAEIRTGPALRPAWRQTGVLATYPRHTPCINVNFGSLLSRCFIRLTLRWIRCEAIVCQTFFSLTAKI